MWIFASCVHRARVTPWIEWAVPTEWTNIRQRDGDRHLAAHRNIARLERHQFDDLLAWQPPRSALSATLMPNS